MTPNNLHIAEVPYGTPDNIPIEPKPLPPQHAKRHCLLILRGCCTEFSDDLSYLLSRRTWLANTNGTRCVLFNYNDATGQYEEEM